MRFRTSRDRSVDTLDSPPPGVKVGFLPNGGPLVVGIYPDADHGTVYRWDDGLDAEPTVINWMSPETAPPGWGNCGDPS